LKLLPWHSLLLVPALLAGAACHKPDQGPRQRPPPAVTTAPVTVRDVPVEIRSPVDLRPLEQADVGSKTLGYLDAVLVDRGDRVRRGQLIAVVRPSDLPDQLSAARSTLAQAQAQAALARANRDRGERLAPTGFVSQQDLQQQQTAVESAEASLAAAQSNVGALATRLGEMRIEAPLDGYVYIRKLDPGALVGPSSGNGAIVTIQKLDTLRVFVPVNERDVAQLRVGQDAHVEVDALPGRTFEGKVVRVAPAFDPLARTLDAEVQLANTAGQLRPGMYGRAAIVTDVHRGALIVPASAIQVSGGKSYVYLFERSPDAAPAPSAVAAADPPAGGAGKPADPPGKPSDPPGKSGGARGPGGAVGRGAGGPPAVPGKVRRVEIATGVDAGDWLEVTKGLERDAELVTAGMDVLSDGVPVRAFRNVDAFTGKPVTTAKE
jgi:RND family efflux transporter MFP subunit